MSRSISTTLEASVDWVSTDGGLENRAFIFKTTGAIFHSSADGFCDGDAPEDIDDETRYWSVPHKNRLELGRSLALRFARQALPEDYYAVKGYFRRRGAYSEFKSLLVRRRLLERWREFLRQATAEALLQWAEECGFQLVGLPKRRAGA